GSPSHQGIEFIIEFSASSCRKFRVPQHYKPLMLPTERRKGYSLIFLGNNFRRATEPMDLETSNERQFPAIAPHFVRAAHCAFDDSDRRCRRSGVFSRAERQCAWHRGAGAKSDRKSPAAPG